LSNSVPLGALRATAFDRLTHTNNVVVASLSVMTISHCGAPVRASGQRIFHVR
jgi:hypothetical protein